ncbi:MAG: putative quinol monooxygenase [Pseudomonadota bacterium]
MICVVATIKAKDKQHDTIMEAFREILPDIQAKKGCIEYSLAIHIQSVPDASRVDPNAIILIEKWSDSEALQAHMADPVYQAWYVKLWPLIEDASMQIFEMV